MGITVQFSKVKSVMGVDGSDGGQQPECVCYH